MKTERNPEIMKRSLIRIGFWLTLTFLVVYFVTTV